MSNSDVRAIIESHFKKKQGINPRYSLRSYANYLGLSPANLSKILSKKAEVTPRVFKKIGMKLSLSPSEYNRIEDSLVKLKKSQSIKNLQNSGMRKLQIDEFNFVSDWYHFAILEIFNLDYFEEDPEWIAKKLGIKSVASIKKAIARLIQLKLLEINSKGKLVPSDNFTSVLDSSFSSVAMRERQKQIMKLSADKIDVVAIEKRDNSSITLTVDEDLLPEIKEKIKDFRRTLGNYIVKKNNKRNTVYELQISFIPLTNEA